MIILFFALVALWAGWPCSWRVAPIAPPVPAWLRNDPELEAIARVMVEEWRRDHPSIVRLWAGAGVQVQNLARYRK